MIIGLQGHQRVGKDTAYEFISAEYPEAVRLAFADKIKESLAALFGLSVEDVEGLKESNAVFRLDSFNTKRFMTWREFIQRYGTEAHRDVFGENFWTEMTLPLSYNGGLTVITDVRFPNEALRIKELGGYIISIKRPDNTTQDNHRSEKDFTNDLVDYEIINDGPLDLFKERVMKVVNGLLS